MGSELEIESLYGPNATFTNDRFPRSKEYPEKYAVTTIEDGASVGANATILPDCALDTKPWSELEPW